MFSQMSFYFSVSLYNVLPTVSLSGHRNTGERDRKDSPRYLWGSWRVWNNTFVDVSLEVFSSLRLSRTVSDQGLRRKDCSRVTITTMTVSVGWQSSIRYLRSKFFGRSIRVYKYSKRNVYLFTGLEINIFVKLTLLITPSLSILLIFGETKVRISLVLVVIDELQIVLVQINGWRFK